MCKPRNLAPPVTDLTEGLGTFFASDDPRVQFLGDCLLIFERFRSILDDPERQRSIVFSGKILEPFKVEPMCESVSKSEIWPTDLWSLGSIWDA